MTNLRKKKYMKQKDLTKCQISKLQMPGFQQCRFSRNFITCRLCCSAKLSTITSIYTVFK